MKKTAINLIPDIVNPTPDYYCTWQTQLYASCDGKPEGQRSIMGEKGMFSEEKPFGWAYFYPEARKDLFFVMDDSWDVAKDVKDRPLCGSLQLDKDKFPESTKNVSNQVALKRLVDRVKALGWKGLGGWVCAQEAVTAPDKDDPKYRITRLKEADFADFAYWKVDWGEKARNAEYRREMTRLARQYAPNLIIEHAMLPELIPCSDVYRTYDVPAVMSIPMTMEKLKNFGNAPKTENGFMGLINCEDEVYIAAAAGYAMGVMRHPYAGAFINGKPDMSFPAVHRNLKTKITEVTRAVRWHRIAPAFGAYGEKFLVDTNELTDFWTLQNRDEEFEAWWYEENYFKQFIKENTVTKSAPARISRGCPLPEIIPDSEGNTPYAVAAKNPNGAFSIATLGRTLNRKYYIPLCEIAVDAENAEFIGVFGEYKSLAIKTKKQITQVLMQDLADDTAIDITDSVTFGENSLIIPGTLISEIGTKNQPEWDTSEPGVVLFLR